MPWLHQNDLLQLITAMLQSGSDTNQQRRALLAFVPPELVAGMSDGHSPNVQLLKDLSFFNGIGHLADGTVPLETYLRNADLLYAGHGEVRKIVRELLSQVVQRSSGAPKIELAALPDIRERIVHVDDMVTFAFMRAGVAAAASVMKLRVPRFDTGQPVMHNNKPVTYLGTGWLLTRSLVMTNHHVVSAREEGEPGPSEDDLRLQARETAALLDFDSDGAEGIDVPVTALEAWNIDLDYAILRIAQSDRAPLRRARAKLVTGVDPVPVNIIQHPGGRGKRYAIRNNLVHKVTPTELFYFTDTESGSSGSPVFNDDWEVVGLHRASRYVDGVQFQGKTTAYVNLGTLMEPIITDVAAQFPALGLEIAQSG